MFKMGPDGKMYDVPVFIVGSDGKPLPSDEVDAQWLERYEVKHTGLYGSDSGRKRYFVKCKECNEVLHSNTTGPTSHIKDHEQEKHLIT